MDKHDASDKDIRKKERKKEITTYYVKSKNINVIDWSNLEAIEDELW